MTFRRSFRVKRSSANLESFWGEADAGLFAISTVLREEASCVVRRPQPRAKIALPLETRQRQRLRLIAVNYCVAPFMFPARLL